MATVVNNPLLKGLTGRLGKNMIFKSVQGKTIIAMPPIRTEKQSEQQRANRVRFKEASAFAKAAMLDDDKKEYYWRKAKKLKLPNAYTAAITDYMRRPSIRIQKSHDGTVLSLYKKDFRIHAVDIIKPKKAEAAETVRRFSPNGTDSYCIYLTDGEAASDLLLLNLRDDTGIRCGRIDLQTCDMSRRYLVTDRIKV